MQREEIIEKIRNGKRQYKDIDQAVIDAGDGETAEYEYIWYNVETDEVLTETLPNPGCKADSFYNRGKPIVKVGVYHTSMDRQAIQADIEKALQDYVQNSAHLQEAMQSEGNSEEEMYHLLF